MTLVKRLIPCVAAIAVLSACGSDSSSSSTSPTSSAPYSQIDLVVGTGATANTGNTATVTYTGYLYDSSKTGGKGTAFQTGSFAFVVGAGNVVKGFDQGVVGMKVGGQRRLTIPPELAYGSNPPAGSAIPVNATLVFEITLTSVQ
jgi:FKBP-type peptidyl-prolyl cis-trans isomerase FkpA